MVFLSVLSKRHINDSMVSTIWAFSHHLVHDSHTYTNLNFKKEEEEDEETTIHHHHHPHTNEQRV